MFIEKRAIGVVKEAFTTVELLGIKLAVVATVALPFDVDAFVSGVDF